jgi:hypothetical protein
LGLALKTRVATLGSRLGRHRDFAEKLPAARLSALTRNRRKVTNMTIEMMLPKAPKGGDRRRASSLRLLS